MMLVGKLSRPPGRFFLCQIKKEGQIAFATWPGTSLPHGDDPFTNR